MTFRMQTGGETGRFLKDAGAGGPRGLGLCLAALALLLARAHALDTMQLRYTWGNFSFAFASDAERDEVQSTGGPFAPQNSTPFDVDVDRAGKRVFLALPSLLEGNAATLATIKDPSVKDSPELVPYPDWTWHRGIRGCDGLTSVFRIFIDECNRLWVIDSGAMNIATTFDHVCPPAIYLFNLTTDELIIRHEIEVPEDKKSDSLLLNILPELLNDKCDKNVFAYVADSGSPALHVFDYRDLTSYRLENPLFEPQENATEFDVDGTSFYLEDGILGLSQTPSALFMHSFSSTQEVAVPKSLLHKRELLEDGGKKIEQSFTVLGSREHQSAGEAFSSNGIQFFGEMGTNELKCWDSKTRYKPSNFKVVEKSLKFLASVKVVHTGNSESNAEVWAIDNSGQRIFANEFKPNAPNTVKIVSGSVQELEKKCKINTHSHPKTLPNDLDAN